MRKSRDTRGRLEPYIIRLMRVGPWSRWGSLAAVVLIAACANPLGRQYEYEEQIYLGIDGSATLVVDASIPALVALRKLPLDPSPKTPVDPDQVRRLFSTAGCDDVRVGSPWIRQGRRFVQVTVQASDVRNLTKCGPVSWSSFTFEREQAGDRQIIYYRQNVGDAAGGDPGAVNWTGNELVGFKLHLPSRIVFHNVKRLEDGSNGEASRGNILTWEQWLKDRRANRPIVMEVRMDSQSILYRTLWLFGGAFVAASSVLLSLVWWTIRRGKRRAAITSSTRSGPPQ
jgi:hypothetical protein